MILSCLTCEWSHKKADGSFVYLDRLCQQGLRCRVIRVNASGLPFVLVVSSFLLGQSAFPEKTLSVSCLGEYNRPGCQCSDHQIGEVCKRPLNSPCFSTVPTSHTLCREGGQRAECTARLETTLSVSMPTCIPTSRSS